MSNENKISRLKVPQGLGATFALAVLSPVTSLGQKVKNDPVRPRGL